MVIMSDTVYRKRNKSFSSCSIFECVQPAKKQARVALVRTITSHNKEKNRQTIINAHVGSGTFLEMA